MKINYFLKFLFTILFLITTISCNAEPKQEIYPGISYQKKFYKTNNDNYLFHLFWIDPAKAHLKALVSHQESGETIKQLVIKNKALIGINTNFFDESFKTLGLVINEKKTLNPLKNISWWGVFYLQKNQPFIVHSKEFKENESIDFALQAGPRLVVNHQLMTLKKNLSSKTAIGITDDNKIVLVITKDYVDINEMAKFFHSSKSKNGLFLKSALNLDGGGSTQLFVNLENLSIDLPGNTKIPVGLGIFPKK